MFGGPNSFGFINQGDPAQPQQQASPIAGLTPQQAQEPRGVYLDDALQQMGQRPQGNPMGLRANPYGVSQIGPGNPGIYAGDPNRVPY